MKPKLIVVDDELDMAGFVCEVAEEAGYDTERFHSAEAFKRGYRKDVDVIVLDLLMPNTDGVELIRFLSELGCDSRLVLVSGLESGVLHSAQKLAQGQGLNVAASLNKPFRYEALRKVLDKLFYTPKRAADMVKLSALLDVDELREMLRSGNLAVHYQPKVDLRTGITVGMEALARCPHPTHGLLWPDQFIPLAEQHGLIDDLTWLVLKKAAMQCRAWCNEGISLQVAVNMSASMFKELELPEWVAQLCQDHGIKPSQMMFEVTETSLMQELVKSLDILTRLRMKGFKLSIDDFGTGYSSLVQLHRAPFSEIKIDRSFVLDLENEPEAVAIVEMVILLGHKLGMKVVAEGVEIQTVMDRLAALGCDIAQGYLISKPLPGSEVAAWLSRIKNTSGGQLDRK